MKIAVYCGSSPGRDPRFTEDAGALGRWMAEQGHELVYGGGNTGLMGTIADAVLAGGGKVTGVLPKVPLIQSRRHPGLTKYIDTPSMAERKSVMIEEAEAYLALPGGIGTLDEITEILSLSSLGLLSGSVVFFNTGGYYEPVRAFLSEMEKAGFLREDSFDRVLFSADLAEIGAWLTK